MSNPCARHDGEVSSVDTVTQPIGMKSIGRRSLVEGAIDQITSQIEAGVWKVGERLPPADKLAEALGISRSPVREAVRALVHAGVLTTRQGAGTYVRAVDEANAALDKRARAAEGAEVIAVRRGLDAAAARSAAQFRTDEDLDRLTDILVRRRVAAEAGDEADFIRLDLEFHVGVAGAAHNSILQHIYLGLLEAIRASMDVTEYIAPNTLSHDHEEQLSAIRDRDENLAAAIAMGILAAQEVIIRGRVQ